MVATHHLASDCKYASVHRMLTATQPFMLPARMATIRYVVGGRREGRRGGGGGERMGCVVLEEEGEDEQSKMQALKCWGEE